MESHSMSRRREEEEEALKWAAIERLPTFARVRRGLLVEERGRAREISVENLGVVERNLLLERLVRSAEKDNESFLLKLKDRIDRVGLEIPTIEVRFEGLNVEAQVFVGSRAVPTVFNFFVNIVEGFLNLAHILPSRKVPLQILQDVSGIIKPQRLALLLGPPSSGKTTLLKALAGRLDKDLKFGGKVTYNGHRMAEFVAQKTSAYISQEDLHTGEMTVRETLAFSARCQGVGPYYEMLAELSRREKAANIKPNTDLDIYMKAAALEGQEVSIVTDYILKILGLESCADTMVGNQLVRGISGGERKRVTTGEILVGPARALFMDEISTGLDSSTTFQIVNSIRQSIHIMKGTAVISLLQPAPETYELFDDVILLSEGQIVYQGPRESVMEFFEFMGFKCPERKGVADFLQEVTSKKDQEQYWMCRDEPYHYVTVTDFSEAFQSFVIGQELGDELARPFDKSKSHPTALTTKKFGRIKDLFTACLSREFLLMKRNAFAYIFKFLLLIILATTTMTIFLRTNMHRDTVVDGIVYLGALYFAVIVAMFNGISELNLSIMQLPVFYKQRDLLFFPSWAYSISTWILKIPISIFEAGIWVSLTYWVIGFDPSAERFFKQFLIILCINQMASSMFRMISAVGRSIIVTSTYGSFALLLVMVLGGFVLSRDDIPKLWLWGYWMSPLMYGQNAIAVNEFLAKRWDKILPNSAESLGVLVLKSRGLFPQASWYWIGVAALVGYIFLFNFLVILAMKYLDPLDKPHAVVREESFAETKANRVGSSIELSSRSTNSLDSEIRNGDKKIARGMVLPFQSLSISFDEIRYSVDMPQAVKARGLGEERLELLKGVSGSFRPGVLTALMGVTGAGKTTLMDVLAGRKTGGYIKGDITISGYPKKQETFARISGYCEQTDIHSPNVTVYESLLYSAWLRLPSEVDSATRKMFIEEVMELVELNPLRGSLVGLSGVDGLSTEQRKRLTIAVELVANPSIIFMDEPTSGLDARAAAIVMRTVRNTVDTGRTVVCTIHQPSIDIFDAFDELLLLKLGGEQIYAGSLGRHSCNLISYFEAINGIPKIKEGTNPATWMLEITSPAQETLLGLDFTNAYNKSELHVRNKALIKEVSTARSGSEDLYFTTTYSQPFSAQCVACLWKQHWSYWRNPSYNAIRLLFTFVTAVVFGLIFWDLGSKRKTQTDLFNAMGSMYSAIIFIGVRNGTTVQPIVDIERTVFYREKAAGMYSALPYAFAQLLIEIPHNLVQTLLYCVIVYTMMGFEWIASKFFWFAFFVFFTNLYFTYYGMMSIAISPNHHIAAISSSSFYAIWNLFSGFVVPLTRIPIWWRWYYWTCPVAWTLYGLVVSQYGDVKDTMVSGERVEDFLRNYFGFKHDFLPVASGVIVGIPLVFGFIFAYAIKTLNFQIR